MNKVIVLVLLVVAIVLTLVQNHRETYGLAKGCKEGKTMVPGYLVFCKNNLGDNVPYCSKNIGTCYPGTTFVGGSTVKGSCDYLADCVGK